MQLLFSNALSEAVSKHFPLSATRLETLAWLTLLIMRQGTICLWRLAAQVAIVARTESVRRRFYRFFQHVELDGAMTARGTTERRGAHPRLDGPERMLHGLAAHAHLVRSFCTTSRISTI